MTPKTTKSTSNKTKRTVRGAPVSQKQVEAWAEEAERGYDLSKLSPRKVGRPAMGSGPADVATVRLTPELREALERWASSHGVEVSAVIRDALRTYLKVS